MREDIILSEKIIFDAKPDAVPYNYRISYKVPQICLILHFCCTGKAGCSLIKIHMLSTALSTKKNMEELINYLNCGFDYSVVRFEPAINRAIKYAIAEGLMGQLKNGKFHLLEKGKKFISLILEEQKLLNFEKEFLILFSKKITNKKIEELTASWRYDNVSDK